MADGLLRFLTQEEVVSLLDRLIDHFPSGEVMFNSFTKFAIWATQHSPGTKKVAELIKFPGVDDPHDFERWNPRLELVKEILLSREPEVAEFPPLQRFYYRPQARSIRWSRTGTVILHHGFWRASSLRTGAVLSPCAGPQEPADGEDPERREDRHQE